MTNSLEDFIAALPRSIEPEFVMACRNDPIRLAVGSVDLFREARLLGHIEGELTLEWIPELRIQCTGDADAEFAELCDDRPVELHVPQLGLMTQAFVTSVQMGQRHEVRAMLMRAENSALQSTEQFRFYLVNFPFLLGDHVRTGNGLLAGFERGRLRMAAGSLVCIVDRIGRTRRLDATESTPGYLLTHVAEIRRAGQPIAPREVHELLDVLYWLLAFVRGARTGPVLPSVDSPFARHWISVAPWVVDEPGRVESWVPTRRRINIDALFGGFVDKWSDPVWNEGLRTTLSWYVAANAPSTPNEARILLCQIALEVLASLRGIEAGVAHHRIRALLQGLRIPARIPPRMQALATYAAGLGVDAPECLTRIRNKLEHPTTENRQHVGAVDGVIRLQAAQYGLELFELCVLAMMNYRGEYSRRAFQGWKGDDEVPVPWE